VIDSVRVSDDSDSARVTYGEVFTRRWVVDLILDLCDFQPGRDLTRLRVIEPSVGSGAFLGPVLERLIAARAKHAGDAPWPQLGSCIRAWDLQPDHVETSRELTVRLLAEAGCPPDDAAYLAGVWLHAGDFLLAGQPHSADLVIGNPPYIRIEDLPAALLAAYRAACPTMGGRADVFVGFYEHGLDLLRPGGRLAFICADRWMRNAYGRNLRRKILDGPYAVDTVLTMHDAPAFDAEVNAYPAITMLRRGAQGEVVTGLANDQFGPEDAERFALWAAGTDQPRSLDRVSVTGARLPRWHDDDDSWPEGSPQTLEWLERLAGEFPVLEDPATGTRLGIGMATGADAVYVRRAPDLPDVEPGRLVPLATAADVRSGEFRWTGGHLVSPWEDGRVVDLGRYPRLAAYYRKHQAALAGRHVARHSESWYRTIDTVNRGLLNRPMLVMGDIKAAAHPVLVPAGYHPHHNLYYVISDGWDLEALGGLLLSEVIERQVAAYCVKMRGGALRFQAQYLRRVRCPRPGAIDPEILAALADAFRARDRPAATRAALRAYGMSALPA
jgi:hypothetical protein